MTPVSVGPDIFSAPWIIGFVIALVVLAAIAWRKGWLGKETEDRIKAKRDKLLLELHIANERLKAMAQPGAADSTSAGINAAKDLLARGSITQEQYDAIVKKIVTP